MSNITLQTIRNGNIQGEMAYWNTAQASWLPTDINDLYWNNSTKSLAINSSIATFTEEGNVIQTQLYIERDDTSSRRSIAVFSNSTTGSRNAQNTFLRSRGGGAVVTGDRVGDIFWSAHDGNDFNRSAVIGAIVDGVVSGNIVPISLIFETSSTNSSGLTEVMRISNNGNVGIKNNDPAYPLDVSGNIQINGNKLYLLSTSSYLDRTNLYMNSGGGVNIKNIAANAALNIATTTSGDITLMPAGVSNVGVNTLTPARRLESLDTANPQLRLTYTDAVDYTDLYTNSFGEFIINPTGSGIGLWTNTPIPSTWSSANVLQISKGATNAAELILDGTARFYFRGGVSSGRIGSLTNHPIIFDINMSQEMLLSSNGLYINGPDNTTSNRRLDVLDSVDPQIRWSYSDNTVYGEVHVSSGGVTTFTTTGNSFKFENALLECDYIKRKVHTDVVSNPPTAAELTAIFGAPATVGAGFSALIDNNGAGTNFYEVTSDGANWWVNSPTKAV